MSLHDRRPESLRRRLRLAALCMAAIALGAASGCTVRPLYSNAASPLGTDPTTTAGLGAININPVVTRYGQELRNHLIFLLNGGAGQPAAPAYTMDLRVTVIDQASAVIQVDNEDRPTAGTLRMTASYTLKDATTGKQVVTGSRDVSSSYDRPSQQFAAQRARRDAENRAARELAELLKLDIGQRLATASLSAS